MTNFMNRMANPGYWDAGVILVWAVVAVVVVLLFVLAYKMLAGDGRPRRDQGGSEPSGGDAMVTLEQRYARGEIDDEEFQRRRASLVGGGR